MSKDSREIELADYVPGESKGAKVLTKKPSFKASPNGTGP
jgi:hypothetical protein